MQADVRVSETEQSQTVRLPWHLATTLVERLAAGEPHRTDLARGERRLTLWRELSPLAGDRETLDERLSPMGIDADRLVRVLGEPLDALAARFSDEPPWHATFRRWWTVGVTTPPAERIAGPGLGLVEVARPLVEGALRELGSQVYDRVASSIDPVLADPDAICRVLLETAPVADLLAHVQRTMVLELNVARVEGRLGDGSPEDRFNRYIAMLEDEATALAIWTEYPVLARLVVVQLQFWIATRLELLDAIVADLPEIRSRLLRGRQPTRIDRIDFGAGDKHRRGRSVAVITFDDGKVVYKPRSLSMDVAFDGLLDWVNRSGLTHQLSRVGIVNRDEHGWVEFVDADLTTDAAGADRYAWRVGALTALLYALHATDFHFENIMAAGEHPILVDLEALLHNDKTAAVIKFDGVADVASATLAMSVQSVGVLPNKLLVREGDRVLGLDVSALGGSGGQLTPIPVPTWEASGTDSMHLVNRRMEMDAERNQPLSLDGTPMDLVSRGDFFVAGFNEAYELLVTGRDELLAPDGPIARFGKVKSRLIARPTHIYARLLLESTHPDFLRDAIERDRSLARLCVGLTNMVPRASMVQSEMAEIRLGDIPLFTVDADTGVLRAGADGVPIGEQVPAPLAAVRERLLGFGEADRELQNRVIRSALAAAEMGSSDARWPNWRRPRAERGAGREQFADEALRVARRLCDLALEDEGSVGWIGLGLVNETYWQLTPAPLDLYVGFAGIAHGLAAVAAVTGDQRVAALAQRATDQIAERANRMGDAFVEVEHKPGAADISIGAFGAIGGAVYALAHAAVRHQRPDYIDAALRLLPGLDVLLREDTMLDVVSGVSGAILALLSLESAAPDRGALDVARRCADRLLAVRTEINGGWGWTTPINPEQPLAGFSHGASGIAVAFARLHAVAPRPEYVEAIRQALRYEATVYDDELRNWRDLRPASMGGRTVMNAWCHGAPGIAMARDELLRLGVVTDLGEQLDAERHRGVLATFATGLDQDPVSGVGNHSLCHGDVGNLLILESALRPEQEPEVAEHLPAVWHTLLIEGRTNGWLCGVPHGVETPGLMTGLAGIAWGLARMADPHAVPDLLTLREPRTDGGAS